MRKPYLFFSITIVVFLMNSGCSPSKLNENTGAEANSGIAGETSVKSIESDSTDKGSTTKKSSPDIVEGFTPVVLYYQDGDGLIIPVTRKLPKQAGIAKASINALVDSAAAREEISYYGLYPVLPEGTEVLGMTIKDGKATVDFNDKLLNYKDAAAEKNIVRSIVYTLTGFDTITGVELAVSGKKHTKMKFGTDLSYVFTRSNLILNSENLVIGQNREKADIYLTKQISENFLYLLPLSVEFDSVEEKDLPNKIIEYLKKDYSSRKLYKGIVSETVLLKSSIENRTLSLYFDAAFKNYGGTARENNILEQLYYSMKQIKGVEKLRIYVDNIEANLPEGSDISGGYTVSDQINNIIDK